MLRLQLFRLETRKSYQIDSEFRFFLCRRLLLYFIILLWAKHVQSTLIVCSFPSFLFFLFHCHFVGVVATTLARIIRFIIYFSSVARAFFRAVFLFYPQLFGLLHFLCVSAQSTDATCTSISFDRRTVSHFFCSSCQGKSRERRLKKNIIHNNNNNITRNYSKPYTFVPCAHAHRAQHTGTGIIKCILLINLNVRLMWLLCSLTLSAFCFLFPFYTHKFDLCFSSG